MICFILTYLYFVGSIASIGIDIRIKNCFIYSWELIGVILALVRLNSEELGTAIFLVPLYLVLFAEVVWGFICVRVSLVMCHSAVSA